MGNSIFDETMVEMKWPEVAKTVQSGAIVLFPTGVIEEHGPHMGLGVDIYMACMVCRLVRQELAKRGIQALIAPPFYWGINQVTASFPGSFSVKKDTLLQNIVDILACLARWGVSYTFNINWHDDLQHCKTVLEGIEKTRLETGLRAYGVISDMLAGRLGSAATASHVLVYKLPVEEAARPSSPDIHAGAGETGAMAAFYPDQVDLAAARTLKPTHLSPEEFKSWREGWSEAVRLTPLGYLGNPAAFDREEGRRFVTQLSLAIADVIEKRVNG